MLGGFVSVMKVKYHDIEFGVDLGNELGVAEIREISHMP